MKLFGFGSDRAAHVEVEHVHVGDIHMQVEELTFTAPDVPSELSPDVLAQMEAKAAAGRAKAAAYVKKIMSQKEDDWDDLPYTCR